MARKQVQNNEVIEEVIASGEFADVFDAQYVRYALSVLEDRAIPDARDGLKPSQRRTLVAMDDLGLKHTGKTKKSAKVCGDVSGNYHPHGEGVIYPTLVRMAQPWSVRYPLVIGQGNFGSVDSEDKAAAMRYCLLGSSRVHSEHGMIRLDDPQQFSAEDISLNVLSRNQRISSASKWFDCGEHPVMQISTRCGYRNTGTHNHPVLVLSHNNGVPFLDWKLLSSCVVGDYVVLDASGAMFAKGYVKIADQVMPNRFDSPRVPDALDENLGFILGVLVAEGSVGQDDISVSLNDGELFDAFFAATQKAFGDSWCRYRREPKGWSTQPYNVVEMHQYKVMQLFRDLGLSATRAKGKTVPEMIWRSPKSVAASFLKGFFDGDGSVELPTRSVRVSLTSISEQLVHEVQTLLLCFGIKSSIRSQTRRGKEFYRLMITGYLNLSVFAEEIGFCSREKTQRLSDCVSRLAIARTEPSNAGDCLPFLDSWVRNQCVENRNWLTRTRISTRKRFVEHYDKIKSSLSLSDQQLLESVFSKSYVFDEITSIVFYDEPQRVYSLRVDSDCHSFVADGFVNHNTEVKLSKAGDLYLADLSKDVVNYVLNYNEELMEPVVLPAKAPMLIINGTSGIAVGHATNMAPHNIREVAEAVKAYIGNPNMTVDELMAIMPGPDFPTGGVLLGQDGVRQYYSSGRGTVQIEGVYSIKDTPKGGSYIHITELPYGASPSRFGTQLKTLIEAKKIDGISDYKNLSSAKGGELQINLKVEVAKNTSPQVLINKLLKQTCLRETFSVNSTILPDGKTVETEVPMLRLFDIFINHRKEVLGRKFTAEKKQHEARLHIIEGLVGISDKIDAVIALIKTCQNREAAGIALVEKGFVSTPEQAEAVLRITLGTLTRIDIQELLNEQQKRVDRVQWLDSVLQSPKKLLKFIQAEQDEVIKSVGDDRKTRIAAAVTEINVADLVPQEDVIITITHDGYIKRLPVAQYPLQNRGTKGQRGMNRRHDVDESGDIFVASTHDIILFFTSNGQMFRRFGYEIPVSSKTAKGMHVAQLLNLSGDQKIAAVVPIQSYDDSILFMATKKGVVKRTNLSEYNTKWKNTAFNAIKLDPKDELLTAFTTDGKQELMLFTRKGKAVRYSEANVRMTGRVTRGIKGMLLQYGDSLVSVLAMAPDTNEDILVVTEYGYGQRTSSDLYRTTVGRVVTGVNTMDRVKEYRNGEIVGGVTVGNDDSLLFLTQKGMTVHVKVSEFTPKKSRTTQGVKTSKLGEGDRIVSFIKVVGGALTIED